MSTHNGISFQDPRNINLKGSTSTNLGVIRWDPSAGSGFATNPFASDDYGLYVNSSGQLVFSSLGSATVLGGGGGGTPSWENLFALDKTFTITPDFTWTIAGNRATATAVVTIQNASGGTGAALAFNHLGTSVNDVLGTGSTWQVTSLGVATFAGISISGTSTALVSTGAAVWTLLDNSATALSIGASGATTMLVFDTTNSAETVKVAGKFTVTGNGSLVTGSSNTVVSLAVANNTATTLGASAAHGVVEARSTSLTTGTLLHLELTEGTLAGGFYLKAWDVTAGAAVFTLGEDGAVVIAGAGATAMLTVTQGDVSITDDTSTATTVLSLAGSGTFTGSTTTSFVTVTPSGLTTGTAVYLVAAALTTGKVVHVVGNAVTSGILVHIASSAASTQLTGAGRLFMVDHTGNASGSGIVAEVKTAAADETIAFQVTGTAAMALGVGIGISVGSMTTGTALLITPTAITTGIGIDVHGLDALTTGKGLSITSAATAIATTGRMFLSSHTGATGTSAILNEFKTSANDETVLLTLTAASLTTGTVLDFGTTAALTTGIGIKMAHTTSVIADGGSLVQLSSSSIDTGGATNGTIIDVLSSAQVAGTIVKIRGSAASSTTATLLSIVQSGVTTGFTGSVVAITGASTTGAGNILGITAVNTTAGDGMLITNNALTLGAATMINLVHGTSVLGAGTSMLRITSTGVDTGTTTGVLLDLAATAATTAALMVITSATLTTGQAIKMTLNGLTTGAGLSIASSSTSTTSAGAGVSIALTGAGGAAPAIKVNTVVQTTHFRLILKETNTVSIWMSDGTTANGALSGTAGDICLNAGSNKPEYCTGTTNWTALV